MGATSRSVQTLLSAYGVTGLKLGVLVEVVVAGRAVVAAGGREDEALHAGLFGEPRETHGSLVIDGVGGLRGEIAQRIVGNAGEMRDGVEAAQILELDLSHVLANDRHRQRLAVANPQPS